MWLKKKKTTWRDRPASDSQRYLIDKQGLSCPLTMGEASDLISKLKQESPELRHKLAVLDFETESEKRIRHMTKNDWDYRNSDYDEQDYEDDWFYGIDPFGIF